MLAGVPRTGGARRLASTRHLFFLGLASGAVYFAGTLYWIPGVIQTYGGLNGLVAVLVGLALVAYLALYPALFAVVTGRLAGRVGRRAAFFAPAIWVATEYARGWVLGGFPWVLLGYSQASVLPIAQLASLCGVYGLSALVSGASGALAYAVLARGRRRVAALVAAGAAVAVPAVWGAARLADDVLIRQGAPISVALVQGNIAQDQKWDRAHANAIFRTYLELSREAAEKGARLIIWPESATPFFFEETEVGRESIRQLAADTRATLLFGSDQIEHTTPPKYFNAAYLVGPDGETKAVYRKIHLVPFGEYVPFKRLLFFASPLVESVSDFSAGDEAVMLPADGHRLSTAICYEIVYPALIRQFVLAGSELLTTITNDAWYGRTSAPHQHFEQAAMRAIEQGRYLARSANTGISAIVDPYGRTVVRSALFERTVLVGEARLLTGRTVYGRTGDLLAYACLALTLALGLVGTIGRTSGGSGG